MYQAFADRFPDHLARLKQAYSQPHRAYHTWEHVEALRVDFGRLQARLHDADAVELALYWHDSVYQPTSRANEAESADWMIREMTDLA